MRMLRSLVVAVLCAGTIGAYAQSGVATDVAPARKIPRISSGVMAGLLKTKVEPVYPAGVDIEGVVVLHVIVGIDGHVAKADAVSGPKMLYSAAIDAVRQWTYRVYLLNGQPTEVDTNVILQFNARR